ncbi:hypothetical protein [Nostoc sp.]|uniref:hypothetical protein n=1 Tax=Nostoc sp. TaxID=1180 RepID=UPI002FF43EF0
MVFIVRILRHTENIFALRDLRENKVPVNRVSTALNSRRLRVERSRNPFGWDTINPQIPYCSISVFKEFNSDSAGAIVEPCGFFADNHILDV